jgi:hypothetical protein
MTLNTDTAATVAALMARVGEFNVRLADNEDAVTLVTRKLDRVAIALVLSGVNFLLLLIFVGAVAVAALVN